MEEAPTDPRAADGVMCAKMDFAPFRVRKDLNEVRQVMFSILGNDWRPVQHTLCGGSIYGVEFLRHPRQRLHVTNEPVNRLHCKRERELEREIEHMTISQSMDCEVTDEDSDHHPDGPAFKRHRGIRGWILSIEWSSIQRVVFHKMSPHETLFLEGTNSLDIKYIANNSFVQFQIWDFPGDFDFKGPSVHHDRVCHRSPAPSPIDDLVYGGQLVNEEMIFGNCGAIVFVIDAQDDPYSEALTRLHDTVARAHRYNPNVFFEVFIHKVDGDLFISDDHKIDCQRDIQQQITEEIQEGDLDIHMSFYLTSIYDHSIFEAFSKVVQKLIPQLPTLENLLNILISRCNMEKSFLFDVVSKVYIATDSNPVDMQSYELCSDMIDVVIDVSCIYGMKDDSDGDGLAYDSQSSSVIRLNTGMVLYLREVNNYLALVCLLRSENFTKQGIIDYNIDCFKSALGQVFKPTK
ncbi:hypothetical protein DYB32_007345 [Aphanomyces invadans]|uniref:Ras-related GTP-binding protein C n=1 Tax=Aphanomyces invadans TaxID=157072 RepID=A0A418AP51_9STRA|nr:hypothetical protein DYB32_007345 [Aphanomyces invadans]